MAKPSRTKSGVELLVRAGAEERLDGRERERRVLRLVRAEQRQEDLLVDAAEALQGEHLPADRLVSAASTPNSLPSRASVAPISALRSRIGRIASSVCTALITVAPLWMMPALAQAMSSMVSPSHSVWSSPIGVITQTPASMTLVASSSPPSPTSTTAMSTGASANAAYAIAVVMSK